MLPMASAEPRIASGPMSGFVKTVLLGAGLLIAGFLSVAQLGSSASRTMDEMAAKARFNSVPSGEHCLDPSIGYLHADLWLKVKRSLHDPDSMRDMVMEVEPVNPNQQHKIRFQFRAKNAYGALRLQTVEAYVMAMGCVLIRWKLV